jgi:hypothetical protein
MVCDKMFTHTILQISEFEYGFRGHVHIHVATNNVESTLFLHHPPTHSRYGRSIFSRILIFVFMIQNLYCGSYFGH